MLAGLRISGGCFKEATDLEIFETPFDRISLIFGRNGSGKSTIARGFAAVGESSQSDTDETHQAPEISAEVLSYAGWGEEWSGQEKISVFNEDFIHENVQFVQSGLGTVALLGPQGNVQSEIDQIEAEIADAVSEQISESDIQTLERASVKELRRLENKLRARWAKVDSEIKGNKVSSKVPSAVGRLRKQTVPKATQAELAVALEKKVLESKRASSGAIVQELVPSFSAVDYLGRVDLDLLSNALEVPSGEGIARLVAESLEANPHYMNDARQAFLDPSEKRCRLCLQEVSEAHRVELLAAIANAIDDAARQAVEALEMAKISHWKPAFGQDLIALDPQLIDQIGGQIASLNSEVDDWNRALEGKKSELYSSSAWDRSKLDQAAENLENSLFELSQQKTEWNGQVKNAKHLKRQAIVFNDQLARIECDLAFESEEAARSKVRSAQTARDESVRLIEVLELKKDRLLASLRKIHLGADQINVHLAAIFADSNRLKLVPSSDGAETPYYEVRSRGDSVHPSHLSVGERNVLALCYFFTKLKEDQDIEGDLNSARRLLVIDDPVSSVDVENRVGIHVFIEQQLLRLLESTPKMRVLLLTHDLTAARALEKSTAAVAGALPDLTVGSEAGRPGRRALMLVRSGATSSLSASDVKGKGRSFGRGLEEYKVLLHEVWKFAAIEELDTDDAYASSVALGNIMRRVLEAFGTFIYDANGIGAGALQEAYARAKGVDMNIALGPEFRLVLHGESHSEDATKSLTAFGGGLTYSSEQLQRTAKRLLVLMYGLQPEHISAYMSDAVADIVRWEEEGALVTT